MERAYQGWSIEVRSYAADRTWRPIVIVSHKTGGSLQVTNLKAPAEWQFDSQRASDEQGYRLGVAWIDRNGRAGHC